MARPAPLADYLDRCLGPALAAQGFASSEIIAAWPEIVGDRLARFSQPIRIEWPRRRGELDRDRLPQAAVLVVRVESAFALDLQHLAPVVIERVNGHYGWRCIGRLVLKQGRLRRPPPPPPRPEPDAARRARVAAATQAVADEGLRAALERLGLAVAGEAGAPGRTKA